MVVLRLLLQTSALLLSTGMYSSAYAQIDTPDLQRRPLVIPSGLMPVPASSYAKLSPKAEGTESSAEPIQVQDTPPVADILSTPAQPHVESPAIPQQQESPAVSSAVATPTPETEATSSVKDLTVTNVIKLALKNSPEHEIALSQINQARSQVDSAKSNYFPQVNLKGEASREYNFPFALRMGATNYAGLNNSNNVAVSVRQMIFDGFITRETVKERLQLLESANVSREKVHEQLIKFTVEVYMELRQFQQIVSAAKDNLDALHDIQHLIDLREKAGDASNVEKNYILARVSSAEKEYVDSQAALSDAFAALTFLIGDVPAFTASLPDINDYILMDSESILQRALKNNSDMRLIASDKKAAHYDLEASKGKFYPTVDFLVDGNQSDDLGGAAGVRRAGSAKLQLNYKLFDGGLRSSAYQLQYDKIKEIDGREKRLTRQIKQDVAKAFNKRQSSGKELTIAEQEITANRDLEKLYREQFKHGDIDIIQLVESQERIFAAQVKKSKLESDLVNVTFELMRSTSDLLSRFCEPSLC